MLVNLNDPKAISARGAQIYDRLYREEFEEAYANKFAAIDVLGESATLGETASEALFQAKAAHPDGFFYLIRVGHTAAFEVGLAYKNVSADRLHR